MAVRSNKTKIFAGLLMGFTLLTTGCASGYISGDVPSVNVPIETGSIATGAVGTVAPTPPPLPGPE